MKIGKILLKGVNNFEDFSCSFEDEWTSTVPASLLLIGPNGCGKTTLLRSIASLWAVLGGFLESLPFMVLTERTLEPGKFDGTFRVGDPSQSLVIRRQNIFSQCRLAAMEIREFLPDKSASLWVYLGDEDEVASFLRTCPGKHKIGGIRVAGDERNLFTLGYATPGHVNPDSSDSLAQWVEQLQDRYIRNRMGGLSDLSNFVFLESETRTLAQIEEEYQVIPEKETFHWLAFYRPNSRREGSIQNYLFTLKAVHEEKYEQIVTAVNRFLGDKQISGFDKTTAELMISTQSGHTHPVHVLSSGEKQVLLILAFIARELRPGGIVLLDEPDLHLHVSLSTAFVNHLKQWVAEQGGQLILASHSPKLWERFTQTKLVELGSLEEGQA